jgi:hypothetical protein
MTVNVDALMHSGWQRHGRLIQHCHVFSDAEDHDEFHAIAQTIGLKRAWFGNGGRMPYDDITPGKRAPANAADAVPVGRSLVVRIWRARRTSRQQKGQRGSVPDTLVNRYRGASSQLVPLAVRRRSHDGLDEELRGRMTAPKEA